MAAWNVAPAPKTVLQTPSTLIRTMAAAAPPISLTAGSPDFVENLHPNAAVNPYFSPAEMVTPKR